MSEYLIIIYKKRDTSDRYYLKRSTLEEAKQVARTYTADGLYGAEIYEAKFISTI